MKRWPNVVKTQKSEIEIKTWKIPRKLSNWLTLSPPFPDSQALKIPPPQPPKVGGVYFWSSQATLQWLFLNIECWNHGQVLFRSVQVAGTCAHCPQRHKERGNSFVEFQTLDRSLTYMLVCLYLCDHVQFWLKGVTCSLNLQVQVHGQCMHKESLAVLINGPERLMWNNIEKF